MGESKASWKNSLRENNRATLARPMNVPKKAVTNTATRDGVGGLLLKRDPRKRAAYAKIPDVLRK